MWHGGLIFRLLVLFLESLSNLCWFDWFILLLFCLIFLCIPKQCSIRTEVLSVSGSDKVSEIWQGGLLSGKLVCLSVGLTGLSCCWLVWLVYFCWFDWFISLLIGLVCLYFLPGLSLCWFDWFVSLLVWLVYISVGLRNFIRHIGTQSTCLNHCQYMTMPTPVVLCSFQVLAVVSNGQERSYLQKMEPPPSTLKQAPK